MRNPFKITISMDGKKIHKLKCLDEDDARIKMEEWYKKLR